ncbi:MAG: hypothetical protein C0498_13915 [Anaerolinea sp.]|jgi:hypothetical protein|nr:hypothetical protein [Anaerolinea sp.]
MVRATAKSGRWAGQPLWRCSDFDCPTLINIDETDQAPVAPIAGESAQARFERDRAEQRERLRRAAPLLIAIGVLLSALGFYAASFLDLRLAALVGVLIATGTAWWVLKVPPEVLDWHRGAEAERKVGANLDTLEPLGFVTLYDRRLQARGGNIDAVTIGPPGVFVVETKWRSRGVDVINGQLEVGGRYQPEAVRQVTELAMLIQVSIAETMNRHRLTVVPVICIGNQKVEPDCRAGGVTVVDATSIAKYLRSMPEVLSTEQVQEIARTLDNALPPYQRRS